MKLATATMFILATSLTSAAWAACPELTGKYTCGEDVTVSITQTVTNDITVYNLDDGNGVSVITTDNISYPFEDKENNTSGTTRVTCENDAVTGYITGQETDGTDKVLSSWDIVQTIKLDQDKNLTVATKGTQTNRDALQPQPVDESFTCKKN